VGDKVLPQNGRHCLDLVVATIWVEALQVLQYTALVQVDWEVERAWWGSMNLLMDVASPAQHIASRVVACC